MSFWPNWCQSRFFFKNTNTDIWWDICWTVVLILSFCHSVISKQLSWHSREVLHSQGDESCLVWCIPRWDRQTCGKKSRMKMSWNRQMWDKMEEKWWHSIFEGAPALTLSLSAPSRHSPRLSCFIQTHCQQDTHQRPTWEPLDPTRQRLAVWNSYANSLVHYQNVLWTIRQTLMGLITTYHCLT